MSHENPENNQPLNSHYEPTEVTADEKADAIAALAIITVGILAAIHFVYTGGLPAWIGHLL